MADRDLFGGVLPRAPAPRRPDGRAGESTPFAIRSVGSLFEGPRDAGPPPASERQAAFATDISRGLGIPLPLAGDATSVGEFITRHRREYADHCRRSGRR